MALKFFTDIRRIPRDKHPDVTLSPFDGRTAKNLGIVTLKCFVNAFTPFMAREKVEHVLTFTATTVKDVLKYSSEEVKRTVTVTPGTDGIHFLERYVYRHNYIFQLRPGKVEGITTNFLLEIGGLNDNDVFSDTYKEIEEGKNSVADQTRYKKEQSWIVVPSVFDYIMRTNFEESIAGLDDLVKEESRENCLPFALWAYSQEKVNSDAKEVDIQLDYKKDFIFTTDVSLPGQSNRDRVDPNIIQMPKQTSAQTCSVDGVHWRLLKRTPLFRGEDFFIEFRKGAKTTSTNKKTKERVPFGLGQYAALDVANSSPWIDFLNSGNFIPRNLAVAPPTVNEDDKGNPAAERQDDTFDFTTQAYYIIEMGHLTEGSNYFIIICERSFPVFIHISGGNLNSGISRILSIFDAENGRIAVSGRQLLNAPNFKMTVRNHLGSLVIQFEGEGIEVDPWIVTRSDIEIDPETAVSETILQKAENSGKRIVQQLHERAMILEVPRGHMTLWGGNIISSFSFGPLQYVNTKLNFIYPPVPLKTRKTNERTPDDNTNFNEDELDVVDVGGSFTVPQFISLPAGEKHEIAFTSTDFVVQEIVNNISFNTQQRFRDSRVFNQDAQFYLEYPLSIKNDSNFVYGSFLGDLALREISEEDAGVQIQHSYLGVTKFSRALDEARRMEVFVISLAMGAGDHLFNIDTGSFVDESTNQINQVFRRRQGNVDATKVGENQWFLLGCKTPICTMMRLRSAENQKPRWSASSIDVSDHVMHYSESWAASDFFSMEHTGTIKFLLNRDIVVNNDVTGDILSLQNKTFYVDIWAGYECPESFGEPYTRMPGLYKLFTGLCHGGTLEETYGNRVMTCKIHDYTKVLKDIKFFNSPFYDGVKDINAVDELLSMAGFRSFGVSLSSSGVGPSYFAPNLIIRKMANNSLFTEQFLQTNIDGRVFRNQPYALPSEYNRLQQPAFKFDDGSNFYDAIITLAKRAGKVFYFDQFGLAHYEDFFDIILQNLLGQIDLPSSFDFTTNPELFFGQEIFNKVDINLNVEDVHNNIKILSNTPDMTPLWVDELNWNSFDDPESEGFLGYLKTFFQAEPVFGSLAATKRVANQYKAMFRPAVYYNFETYGLPLRALDMVSVDGQSLRVMKVDYTIDPAKNSWWMTVEGQRFQPIQ